MHLSAMQLMMFAPLAAVIAIVLAYQQQRLAAMRANAEELQRSVAHLEALFEQAPLGMAVFDTQGRYVRINRLLARINGYAAEDHIGKTLREMVPDVADASEAAFHQVMQTRRPAVDIVYDGATSAQPGVKRHWRVSVHPVLGAAGEVLGVSTTVQDITEQHCLAAALRDSEQRERRRAAELERVMDAAPVALLLAHDRGCRHVSANAAARRLLRLEPGESPSITGPGIRAFDFYRDGNPVAPERLPLQLAAASGEESAGCALALCFAGGDRMDVLVNALALRDESGRVRGAAAALSVV
jgi:PAS domain S-box-containing protein